MSKLFISICLCTCVIRLSLCAEEPLNHVNYESMTGFKGSYNEKEQVFKASFPRNDIKISVDNLPLDPFMGLTSWAAFTPINKNKFMVMGDLVLLQDEVNPVMSLFLSSSIEVTALHNHFFYDSPKVYFMHIAGKGSLKDLAEGVKKAFSLVKEIRAKNGVPNNFRGIPISNISSIDLSLLEKVFDTKGQSKEGMVKFVFGRTVQMEGLTLRGEMGVNTWAAFAGTNDNAIVDGDFAVLEEELQPVLKVLRKGGINIVAIHNHMKMESPRMIFLHYWGQGNAQELAKSVNEALSLTK